MQMKAVGFFGPSNSLSNITAQEFITLLNEQIIAQQLEIVNSPQYLESNRLLAQAKKEIARQEEILEKLGSPCGTTNSLVYFSSDENALNPLSKEEMITYQDKQADMVIESKKCTCVGLSAVALKFARQLLKDLAIHNITVDICALRNWGHSLMRVSQTKADETEIFFYDPWYQQCYTNTPKSPKIFANDQLGVEIRELIKLGALIEPTKELIDLHNVKSVINSARDYGYFVVCSTGDFSNPALEVSDPTLYPEEVAQLDTPLSWCPCPIV